MKRGLKRAGALVLAVLLLIQSFVGDAYAAENTEETSLKIETAESDEEITRWIIETIIGHVEELENKPEEWWESLSDNQRLAAEIFMEPVPQNAEDDGIQLLAFTPSEGDQVAYMSLSSTGYTDGKGNTFWWIRNGGKNAYCMQHGASLRSSYAYGDFTQTSGPAQYLIKTYGGAANSEEWYMSVQMAVWAWLAGQSASSVYTYAFSWFVKGGMDSTKAAAWAQTTNNFFSYGEGQSDSCYIAQGPAGSQPIGNPYPFVTTAYTAGGSGGSGGGEEEPEPEVIEPEYDVLEDSITVNYQVGVKKTDWQTGVGLLGCQVDIFENGSKIGTVTTDSSGNAVYKASKSSSFSAEYCTNYDELSEEKKAEVQGYTSLEEAENYIDGEKKKFENRSYTYSCREVKAPLGYVWQGNEKSATISGNESSTFHITNERTLGMAELIKYDTESESDQTQGEASLEGAVYGIFAAEDIVHQDKKSGVIYKKDTLIATGTIGRSPVQNGEGYLLNADGNRHIDKPAGTIAYYSTPGKTAFGDLELGKYYIKEIVPTNGYMLDETIYDVTFTYKDQNVKVEVRNETAAQAENTLTVDDGSDSKRIYSGDYCIKQGISFVKTSDNDYQTELSPIKGAGFCVYLISDLSGVKDGSLKPVNGNWGTDDILTFYDYDFTEEPRAKLYKRTNETWTKGDTQWLKSLGNNFYEVSEMFTDEKGRIETPELPFGTYVIVETTTPKDHVCAKPFIAKISEDGGVLYTDAAKQNIETTYKKEDSIRYGDRKATKTREGRIPQDQRIINNAVTKTFLRIVKADEEFAAASGTIIQPEEVVRGTVLKEGAKYRVRCLTMGQSEESLKALRWKYDEDGYLSYYLPSAKKVMGTEKEPFTTDFLKTDGKIKDCYITLPQQLPVGSYELAELTAPEGYVVNGWEQSLKDVSEGRVNGYEILDTSKEKEIFTIGNGTVYPDGQMGTNKYTLQDEHGNLVVTVLQKNQAQKGIVEVYKHGEQLIDAKKITEEKYMFVYEDAPVEGAQFQIIAEEDIYTQELDLGLLDKYDVVKEDYLIYKEGEVAATITTDCNGWGYAGDLLLGKYKIVETAAGDGFVRNPEEKQFEITAKEQTICFDIHAVDYKNERQKLEIEVNKTDAETKTPLSGAKFGLYTLESIGVNVKQKPKNSRLALEKEEKRILVEEGTLIAVCITDESGKGFFEADLPLGTYEVRELEAPEGYQKTEDVVVVDGSYSGEKGGQDVEKQIHTVAFENKSMTEIPVYPETPEQPKVPETPKKEEKKEPEIYKAKTPAAPNIVKTGDDSQIILWLGITGLALGGSIAFSQWKKRKNTKN